MVNLIRRGLVLLGLLSFLVSCSSGGRKERARYQELFLKSDFESAREALEKGEMAKDSHSRFLYLVEKGTLAHTQGFYLEAIKLFEEANDVAEALYTKRISQKAASIAANDNYQDYAGEKYERSLLYFYLVMSEYFLYQQGVVRTRENPTGTTLSANEKKQYLTKARAHVLMWDSVLSTFQKETTGEQVFKNDLLQKLVGAMVHKEVGTSGDLQIALQLYKDAKRTLMRNFNAYPSFNLKASSFQKDYSKLPNLREEELIKDYIAPTEAQIALTNWLDEQILRLVKRTKNNDLDDVAREMKVSAEVVKKIKAEQGAQVTFVLQENVIDAKTATHINIGLKGAMEKAPDEGTKKAIMNFGTTVLSDFAANKLGLYQSAQTMPQAIGGTAIAQVAVQEVAIEFELPKVAAKPNKENYQLEVYSGDKKIQSIPLVLASNLSEVAEQAVNEHAVGLYWKTGLRVASKHLVAIIAAYKTYKLMSGSGEGGADFLARIAAVAEYVAASKVIAASEKADTRSWVTGPFTVRMGQVALLPGTYQLRLVTRSTNKEKILGEFTIEKSQSQVLLTERLLP